MALGFFDPTAVPLGWFDETADVNGWFDEDLLAAGVSGVSGTQAITFEGMTSAGTGTVDVAGDQGITFEGMTSSGTGTVDIAGEQGIVFEGMTSSGTATVDVVGESTVTFEGMTSSGTLTVEGEEPAFTPTVNFAGGVRKPYRQHQIGVRLDGRIHFVSYQEAADLVARQAEADASRRQVARTRDDAKVVARVAVQKMKARLTVEQPLQFEGVDTSLVANGMFRDLMRVYTQQLIESLQQPRPPQQSALMNSAEAERIALQMAAAESVAAEEMRAYLNFVKRQDDEQAVLAAVELLVIHGD